MIVRESDIPYVEIRRILHDTQILPRLIFV